MTRRPHDPRLEAALQINRRQFFGRTAGGIGTAALASVLNPADHLECWVVEAVGQHARRKRRRNRKFDQTFDL